MEKQVDSSEGFLMECRNKTGVDVRIIEAAKNGQFADDVKLKEYMVCLGEKTGFLDDAGNIQHHVLKNTYGSLLKDQELANRLDQECAVMRRIALQDLVFEIVKCYYEKNPKHIIIL